MSPEARRLLDIYMALRSAHLTSEVRYHSDLPIEVKAQFELAWKNFSDVIGQPHLAVALYEREKADRMTRCQMIDASMHSTPIDDQDLLR